MPLPAKCSAEHVVAGTRRVQQRGGTGDLARMGCRVATLAHCGMDSAECRRARASCIKKSTCSNAVDGPLAYVCVWMVSHHWQHGRKKGEKGPQKRVATIEEPGAWLLFFRVLRCGAISLACCASRSRSKKGKAGRRLHEQMMVTEPTWPRD